MVCVGGKRHGHSPDTLLNVFGVEVVDNCLPILLCLTHRLA